MRISVIVAIYNIEEYVRACVDSLLAAKVPCSEILLVDDGSTDRSGEICDSYDGLSGSKVTIYHKCNAGLSDARNYGLERANGEWIIFVDGDDIVIPEKFAEFCEYLCSQNVTNQSDKFDVVMNDYYLHNMEKGKTTEICQVKSTLEKTLRQPGTVWNVWRYAYRREFIEGMRFKVGYLAEDLDFTISVLSKAKVVCIHSPYYMYSYHRNGSITQVVSMRYIRQVTELIREHYAKLGQGKIAKLLRRKLLRDYVAITSRFYDYSAAERIEFRRLYSAKCAPIPINITLIAPLMSFLRKVYHLAR